jgi:hypothetical protein
MSLNVGQKMIELLQSKPMQRFPAKDIARWIFETYPQQCQQKRLKSQRQMDDAQLLQQLTAEVGARRQALQNKYPALKTTEGFPRHYYWSEQTDSAQADEIEASGLPLYPDASKGSEAEKFSEKQMYGLLAQYALNELQVHTKRIDEKTSSNRRGAKGNIWLHPDMVGVMDLGERWHSEIQQCVSARADQRGKLWSFEAKLLLNRSNVREHYFQTVSNSSWANFGYLVTMEIVDNDTLRELRMLNAAHGIGLIQLDRLDSERSSILIPARERGEIDWEMANRLANENKDFLAYIKLIKQFYQTGEIRSTDWDSPADLAGED